LGFSDYSGNHFAVYILLLCAFRIVDKREGFGSKYFFVAALSDAIAESSAPSDCQRYD